jgi:hypothetical protein
MADNAVMDIDILGSWVEVGMVMAALTAGIFLAYPLVKHIIKKRKKGKCIWKELPTAPKFVKLHTKVHEQLTELRVVGNAARCQVMQFHNGGQFLDGSSIKRFSLTHESCRTGISETRHDRQDVMLTMFGEMLELITTNNPTPILTSDLPDCHWKRHLESNNVIMFSLISLRNSNGMNIIGCLSLEWCSWLKADAVDEEDIRALMQEKRRYIEAELASQNI